MYKQLLRPDRLRHVPAQFSWVDHRLVREGHLRQTTPEGLALYLFLVTVSDAQGMSYYGDRRCASRTRISTAFFMEPLEIMLKNMLFWRSYRN